MTDRERLAKMLYEDPPTSHKRPWEYIDTVTQGAWCGIADRLLAKGVTLPPEPTQKPDWPGLDEAWTAFDAAMQHQGDLRKREHAALAVAAPILWRAAVNALPQREIDFGVIALPGGTRVHRRALLAVADQYDRGRHDG